MKQADPSPLHDVELGGSPGAPDNGEEAVVPVDYARVEEMAEEAMSRCWCHVDDSKLCYHNLSTISRRGMAEEMYGIIAVRSARSQGGTVDEAEVVAKADQWAEGWAERDREKWTSRHRSRREDTEADATSIKEGWEGEVSLDGGIAIRLENPLRERGSATIWAKFIGDGIPYGTEILLSPEKAGEIGRKMSEVLGKEVLADRHRVVLHERGSAHDDLELRLAHHESLDLSYHEIAGSGLGKFLLAYTVFDGGESDRYYFLADRDSVASLAERFSAASEIEGQEPSE